MKNLIEQSRQILEGKEILEEASKDVFNKILQNLDDSKGHLKNYINDPAERAALLESIGTCEHALKLLKQIKNAR